MSAVSLSLTAFAFYHTQVHLSRTFFKFFQISLRCLSLVVLANNFAMLAHPLSFVKLFFHFFPNFFRIRYSFAPPAGDLHILARHAPFVKHYFTFFSSFFTVDSSHPLASVFYPFSSPDSVFSAGFLSLPVPESDRRFPDF